MRGKSFVRRMLSAGRRGADDARGAGASAGDPVSVGEDAVEMLLAERKRMAALDAEQRRGAAGADFPQVRFSSGALELTLCSHPTGFDASEGWDEYGRVDNLPKRPVAKAAPSGSVAAAIAEAPGAGAAGRGEGEGAAGEGDEDGAPLTPTAALRLAGAASAFADPSGGMASSRRASRRRGSSSSGSTGVEASISGASRSGDPVAVLSAKLSAERQRRVAIEAQLAATVASLRTFEAESLRTRETMRGPTAGQAAKTQRRALIADLSGARSGKLAAGFAQDSPRARVAGL